MQTTSLRDTTKGLLDDYTSDSQREEAFHTHLYMKQNLQASAVDMTWR